MTKKKILIIHSSLGGGGAEKVLIDILRHFDYSVYDVTLFLLYKQGIYLDQVPADVHVKKEQLSIKPRRYWTRLLLATGIYGLLMKYCARKAFKGDHFDTIISFMEGGAALCHQYLFDKAMRHVTWVHTDLHKYHYTKYLFPWPGQERKFYTRVDEVIFVSNKAKENFILLFGLHKGRIIYNLIDKKRICELAKALSPQRNAKVTIVNVGRLVPQKRQERIIEVAAILKGRGIHLDFWILGAGALENELKQMAMDKGVADRVHFYGFIANPYPYIKVADVFLLTSDVEGFPLVVCEAMCLGRAIVSTHITGPTEILDNGKYGILTELSAEDIADKVMNLANDPIKIAKYGCLATERANSLFDIDGVMRQIYNAIDPQKAEL